MINKNVNLTSLLQTISTLRGQQGCPWDRKQTCVSLKKYLQAECTELLEAIDKNDHKNICEELGDVLYVLIMISEINNDLGFFGLNEVIESINAKLIRRHPHVFAGTTYENDEQLAAQWQAIKAMEKKENSI
jgi:MazG family protein